MQLTVYVLCSLLTRDKNERKEIKFDFNSLFMPILWYTPKNRRRKRAKGEPLDPVAALALNASAVDIAIKKQRTSVKSRTEVLWVGC